MKNIILVLSVLWTFTTLSTFAQDELNLFPEGIAFPHVDTSALDTLFTGMTLRVGAGHFLYYSGSKWKYVGGPLRSKDGVIQQRGSLADDFILGSYTLPYSNYDLSGEHLVFFDYGLGAFRGGSITGDSWGTNFLGDYSFAYGDSPLATGIASVSLGFETSATGDHSVAMGNRNVAAGRNAVALGYSTEALGDNGCMAVGSNAVASGNSGSFSGGYITEASGSYGSIALGSLTEAKGDYGSVAIGRGTISTGNHCTVVGMYNDTIVETASEITDLSPIFIVGNGDIITKSNALVVRKDGNVSIGNGVPNVKFKVGENGDGTVAKANAWNLFSDRRHKENIRDIITPMFSINKLKGRRFRWKASGREDLGFIAQEVEEIFPELVHTDEGGFKSLDYSKLVPVLVESVKDLNNRILKLEKLLQVKNSEYGTIQSGN